MNNELFISLHLFLLQLVYSESISVVKELLSDPRSECVFQYHILLLNLEDMVDLTSHS